VLREGTVVTDEDLRRIARRAAAPAVALAAAVFCVALLAWLSPGRAALWSVAVACSIGGAGTLGQALWQQTAALPLLTGAIASLAWAHRRWPAVLTPACLVALVLARPPELALAVALSALWLFRARDLTPRALLLAGTLAVAAALPFVAWNIRYFGSPLPTGQWDKNELGAAFQVPLAVLGLLVSPGRGALWFAPVLVAALALGGLDAWRRRLAPDHLVVLGVLAQVLLVASFTKWWGGYISFGPRLLALPLWAGVAWLARTSRERSRGAQRVVHVALCVSAIVGVLGGALFDPAKWQHTEDPSRLWQIVDSPLPALFRPAATAFVDTLSQGPFVYCKDGLALAPP
jgi:hypothetical protein